MATGLHGAARTTPRVRAELQAAQESTRTLATRYGLNAKTVAKWRKRTSTADRPMGPSRPKSTVLTEIEDFGRFEPHNDYGARLRCEHRRKNSFWSLID